MNLLIDSVRASSRRSPASRCPATGKVVEDPPAFATFRGDAVLADAGRHAPELAKIAALIPADAVPSAGELTSYGILARSPGAKLSSGGDVFEPRPFDVASVGGTAVGRWLTPTEAETEAPNLAAALHAHYGTQPAPQVAPPSPPPETDVERQAREQREQEHGLEQALRTVAWTTDPGETISAGSMAKAARLVSALRVLLAA